MDSTGWQIDANRPNVEFPLNHTWILYSEWVTWFTQALCSKGDHPSFALKVWPCLSIPENPCRERMTWTPPPEIKVSSASALANETQMSCKDVLYCRERSHIPPLEKENHLEKCLGMGYVKFQIQMEPPKWIQMWGLIFQGILSQAFHASKNSLVTSTTWVYAKISRSSVVDL